MTRKALDPALASILDSIRATVGGETAPAAQPETDGEPEAQATTPAKPARKGASASARTVEEFLADLIRPQVDSWLKANLPEIVQKLAAEEIARLTDRK
jgi:cell pole-organizing protein PopZ